MAPNQNEKPSSYAGPRTGLSRRIVANLLSYLMPKVDVAFKFDDERHYAEDTARFVLCPPTLLQTIYMLIFPDFWVGAHYSQGRWYLAKGDLADFLQELLLGAPSSYLRYFGIVSKIRGPVFAVRRYLLDSSDSRKVSTHYEIDSDFYESFLDDEMIYTCAFFEGESCTLEEAQSRKMSLVAERLKLPKKNGRVLDVGSGWGGFDRYLVRNYPDIQITGLSLALNQINWAKEKNNRDLEQHQADRISYEQEHYLKYRSDDSNLFGAIVVVGMIEHIGLSGYDKFVDNTKRLLKSGGRCLVHTIVSPESSTPSNKWIDAFIFPGGYTPSLSELVNAFEVGGMIIENVFLHEGRNYCLTLESWRQNFLKNWMSQSRFPADQAFGRMWHFYLSVARNMFDENVLKHQVAHIVVRKL